ncbi:right-handed parallel beta-helix repeat-containing protein [Pontiellaceae bacterium B12227]|nr:right-handed parallel beta-helix repeat-containing protein [Pontiellaceae bacterium B12227]
MKTILLALLCATTSYAAFDIQEAIDDAKSGSVITVPKGTYRKSIFIKKGITLQGEGVIFKVESNQPAILIDSYKTVFIKGITIQWKTESKPQKGDTPYALFVRNGEAELNGCTFEALGNGTVAPGAVSAQDKSEVAISNCRFDGFEYTVQYWNGAEGEVRDCILLNPGHCGITIGSGSSVELTGNIITGSRYHAVRCTGGEIEAHSNLIIRNKNRGFYIGSRSAIGEISNNLIVDNATGINVFANSKLEIGNNVIARSSYAGLAIIDTAKLDIEDNIIVENEKGIVGFSAEKGKTPSVSVDGKNVVFGNKTEVENIDLTSKTIKKDPRFSDDDSGLYKTSLSGMGLEDPAALKKLWIKWQAALDGK